MAESRATWGAQQGSHSANQSGRRGGGRATALNLIDRFINRLPRTRSSRYTSGGASGAGRSEGCTGADSLDQGGGWVGATRGLGLCSAKRRALSAGIGIQTQKYSKVSETQGVSSDPVKVTEMHPRGLDVDFIRRGYGG